jgi:hypothetical protein
LTWICHKTTPGESKLEGNENQFILGPGFSGVFFWLSFSGSQVVKKINKIILFFIQNDD